MKTISTAIRPLGQYLFGIIVLLIWVVDGIPAFANELEGKTFEVNSNIFDTSNPVTLGLHYPKNIHHHSVFTAKKNTAQYNHGAVLFPFKGKLYVQWQSSAQDEDAPETRVLFSRSVDGSRWSNAKVLVAPRKQAVITNGGWWSDGRQLIAYINVWPNNMNPKGGYVEYISSQDGVRWTKPKRITGADGSFVEGILEQDLKALPNGRVLTALHQSPGLIATPFYTDDPQGVTGWTKGQMLNLPHKLDISRELEPSWFLNANKEIVMVFRDQDSSFRVLASKSTDNALTWSQPTLTTLADSRAKQSAGNLIDGTAYLVNNPSGTKQRMPLVLTLGNGNIFDRAFLLGDESQLPPLRFDGKFKRLGFSYPKSLVWKDSLWISYAINKEDIRVTKVPLDSLAFP